MRKLSPTSFASVALVVLFFEGGQTFELSLDSPLTRDPNVEINIPAGCPNNVVTGPKGYCVNNFNRKDYVVRPGIGAHKLFKHQVTWNEARETCMREGGQLPMIDSAEKETIFRTWMNNEMVDNVWLGIHDRFVEGTWVTLMGEPAVTMSYYPWAKGEPNNANDGEDCGELSKTQRPGINDFSCFGRFSYICEIKLCNDL